MSDLIIYLLKCNLALILFCAVHHFLLKPLTFYNLNRFYLLFALVFSLLFPLVNLQSWFVASPVATGELMQVIIPDWEQIPIAQVSFWDILSAVFVLGCLYFLIRLGVRLYSLRLLHRKSVPAQWQQINYRQVFEQINPFSFWRNIYLNIQNHQENDLLKIFEHELIHVRGLHTFDILLAEICRLVCWFNPAAWFIRHAIHENLEFIADRRVIRNGVDKKVYQFSLLNVLAVEKQEGLPVNNFNFKSLKRRIMMMNKKNSSRLHVGKYVFAIPVLVLFLLVFTISKAYQPMDVGLNDDTVFGLVSKSNAVEAELSVVPAPKKVVLSSDTTAGTVKVALEAHDSVPGVFQGGIVRAEGNAMKPDSVLVKLAGSKGDKVPLFVMDGVPLKGKDISEIDPNDIENITVLKDASATSIYGAEGQNGVILITSKSKAKNADKGARQQEKVVVGKPIAGESDMTVGAKSIVESLNHPDLENVLIIIDGKESTAAALSALSTQAIESVTILKDSAAAEIYGEKAKQGVVVVTLIK